MRTPAWLAALAVTLLVSAAASASTDLAEAAATAWSRGDHAAARPMLRRLALEGDEAAMTLLGVMSARGLGVPRSPAVAAAWYMKAARADHVPALLALADAFRNGRGVVRDEHLAEALEARARNLGAGSDAVAAR